MVAHAGHAKRGSRPTPWGVPRFVKKVLSQSTHDLRNHDLRCLACGDRHTRRFCLSFSGARSERQDVTSDPMRAAASILALGFLLGLRHATDADHVVAVTTIVARERRLWAASIVGVLWGLGHTLTLLIVGGAIVFFKLGVPARIGLTLELAVAAMLIALGIANLVRFARAGEPEATRQETAGIHASDRRTASTQGSGRALGVGIVHGLAGSAAIALLVLSTIGDSPLAIAYLAIFGAGTIAGMALLTTVVALPIAAAARRFERVNLGLARLTGIGSIVLGLFIGYQLIVVHGLFSSSPNWIPA